MCRARYARPARAKPELTALEERVLPDAVPVRAEWTGDAEEGGTQTAIRFTRTADQAAIDTNTLTVSFLTTGRDGMFYALYRAPNHGSDTSHRSPLKRDDAKKVLYAVTRLARLSGDERWVPPKLLTEPRIEALKPTNQVAGYKSPQAKNPDAANVRNDAHRLAAQYERVLAYQVHKGGG